AARYPMAASDGAGNVWCVWTTDSYEGESLVESASDPQAANWGAPIEIASNETFFANPWADATGGTLYVAYYAALTPNSPAALHVGRIKDGRVDRGDLPNSLDLARYRVTDFANCALDGDRVVVTYPDAGHATYP